MGVMQPSAKRGMTGEATQNVECQVCFRTWRLISFPVCSNSIEEEEEEACQRVFLIIIKEHSEGRVDCWLWERLPAQKRI
jgi:hypothetical protein